MQRYPAKLLLFGEHVLLLGASALAVPVPGFALEPVMGRPRLEHNDLHRKLLRFAESAELGSVKSIDRKSLVTDLENGLFFRSDIPSGYGLGSSGALCASIYDLYSKEKTGDLGGLKAVFAVMESFFHGSSSGIDPLTSYLAQPLLIRNKTEVSVAEIKPRESEPVIFLLDTGLPRQTGPLVQWFLEQSKRPAFLTDLNEQLLPAHESMVRAWLDASDAHFWAALDRVSAFQFSHFAPMIPDIMRPLWKKSLETPGFSLKICGAGGGGFMLGFAGNRETAMAETAGFPIIFPFSRNDAGSTAGHDQHNRI